METQREMGCTLSPFATFLLLQGLETLHIRVDRHTSNALKLATWLDQHPAVLWTSHPSLPSHPSHEIAKKYLKRGSGGMLSFALKPVGTTPSDVVAQEFIDATKLAVHAPNVGDVRTLVVSFFCCCIPTRTVLTVSSPSLAGPPFTNNSSSIDQRTTHYQRVCSRTYPSERRS